MNSNGETGLNKALFEYCLRIGDTCLIAGQRLGEWCGHGPALEEDIALSNMALDLIGQSRLMLTYAGQQEGKGRTEDDLAYRRDERGFRNLLLAEQPNGDFAMTITRQFFLSAYFFHLYEQLISSSNEYIKSFAAKSRKEMAYHLRHTSDWMLRLGDGTAESHDRLQLAVDSLWLYTDDIFHTDETDKILFDNKITGDTAHLKRTWTETIGKTFSGARLNKPDSNGFMRMGSRDGKHTEHLGHMLSEMQFLVRAYPDAKW